MTVRQTPKPSRSFAKRVVRTAGPQEKGFFTNSTLTSATENGYPSTFVNFSVVQGGNRFNIFESSDWQATGGSRERCLIRRLDCRVYMFPTPGSLDYGHWATIFGTLLMGTEDSISDQVTAPDTFPFLTQGSVISFADLSPKVVRFAARKYFNMYIPGAPAFTDATEAQLTALVNKGGPRIKTFTIRNKWVTEPEQVSLYFHHVKQAIDNNIPAEGAGSIIGWLETYCRYSTF